MINVELLDIAGLRPAILSTRLSWSSEGDSGGPKDLSLLAALAAKSDAEGKALRMIVAWFSLRAPRYFWQEFDTYRVGVEKGSASTMHTLMQSELREDDFAMDTDFAAIELVKKFIRQGDFRAAKANLPEGFMQKRVVMASYAALRRIWQDRHAHRLAEWRVFCTWLETLPNARSLLLGEQKR